MTRPSSQAVRDRAADRYLSSLEVTIAEVAAEIGYTERTVTRWLAERREREE